MNFLLLLLKIIKFLFSMLQRRQSRELFNFSSVSYDKMVTVALSNLSVMSTIELCWFWSMVKLVKKFFRIVAKKKHFHSFSIKRFRRQGKNNENFNKRKSFSQDKNDNTKLCVYIFCLYQQLSITEKRTIEAFDTFPWQEKTYSINKKESWK